MISLTGDNCFQSAQTFSFNGTSSVVSVTWNFGDPSSGANNSSSDLNPSHQFSEIGTYQITAIVFDCYIDTLTQNITLFNCTDTITPIPAFEFPNIFTPNNDGINDLFNIDNLPQSTEVVILNRWGNVVFSSENYQNDWDGKDTSGKELADGVYTYKFTTETGEIGHGFVHLVR